MDAWEILTSNSSLESGDVWEHLLSQGGGVSSCTDLAPVVLTAKAAIFTATVSNAVQAVRGKPQQFSGPAALTTYAVACQHAAFAVQLKRKINGYCR